MKNKIYAVIACLLACSFLFVPSLFVCATEPVTPVITYCNISFDTDVYVKYAVAPVDSSMQLLAWAAPDPAGKYEKGSESVILSPVGTQEIEGTEYTIFNYTDLVAKQMTDDIYTRAYLPESGTYGELHKYSILQYAYNKLGKTGVETEDESLKTMLREMLEYGAAAQQHFSYHTDRLATSDFYQVLLSDGRLPDGTKNGLYPAGTQVTLQAEETDTSGLPFSHWTDHLGNRVSDALSFSLTVGTENKGYMPVYVQYSSGLEFESNGDGTCYLIGIGTCTDTDVKIPAMSPDGDLVKYIDRKAFMSEGLTSVTIPTSVIEIGSNAFNGCAALTDVYYEGSESDWALIDIATGNDPLQNATKHFAVSLTFTVTFVDYNGAVLKTETVKKGASATAPTPPPREGYTFTGWDVAFDNITSNLTVTAQYRAPDGPPTFVVSNATAAAGEENVAVTVSLRNNPGVTSMLIKIAFDDTALDLVSMTYNADIGGQCIPNETTASPLTAYWADGFNDVTGDWVFVTLLFNVSSSASAGNYDITVTYQAEDVYNANETDIDFDITNGKITVS